MQKMRLLLLLLILLSVITIVNAAILVYEENQCPIILMQQTSVPRERETVPSISQGLICCNTEDGYAQVFQDYCINELKGNIASDAMCAQVCCEQQVKEKSVSRWEKNLLGNCQRAGGKNHDLIMCKPACCKLLDEEGPVWHDKIAGYEPISIGMCQEMKGEVLPVEECNDICCTYRNPKTGLQTLNVLSPTTCNRNGGEKVDIPVDSCNSYENEIQPGLDDILVCCKIQDNGPGQNTEHRPLPSKECKKLGNYGGTTTKIVPKEACDSRDRWRVSNKRFCFFNPQQYSQNEPQINPPQGLVFAGESIRYSFKGPPEENKCFACRFNEQTQLGYFEETNCNQKLNGYNWNKNNVNSGDDSYRFGIPNACIFGPSTTYELGGTSVTINVGESVKYTYINGDKGCFTCSYPESGDWIPQLDLVNCDEVSNTYDLNAEKLEGITPEGLRGSYSPITGQSFRSTGTNTGLGFFSKIIAFFSSLY